MAIRSLDNEELVEVVALLIATAVEDAGGATAELKAGIEGLAEAAELTLLLEVWDGGMEQASKLLGSPFQHAIAC